ncbi:hypothetical protein N6H13_02620 [Paenibacillus sp. CC-CFT742]|nr:glycoside hydrolase family 30 beta sandwich domain-containing protein [Paenibacillus sp. CC-CFT742]WJH29692.1 hypothetical protein N6H13_02620 [Paenibacillus sp. CC-CFT742]
MNQQTGELVYTLDYYALAHFSAIIRPQAVRIESSSSQESIYNVAFRNKDGSIAVVLFNEGEVSENIRLKIRNDKLLNLTMEPQSAWSILIPNPS